MNLTEAYVIFELSPAASEKEIRKKYRQLALLHHPDVAKTDTAHQQFLKIKEAYTILLNSKRQKTVATLPNYTRPKAAQPTKTASPPTPPTTKSNSDKKYGTKKGKAKIFIRRRQKEAPISNKKRVAYTLLVILGIAIIPLTFKMIKIIKLNKLEKIGIETYCEILEVRTYIISDKINDRTDNIIFTFWTKGDTLIKDSKDELFNIDLNEVISSNGLPVKEHMKYRMLYNPIDPYENHIFYDEPDAFTIEKYKAFVAQKFNYYLENSSPLKNNFDLLNCHTEKVFETFGTEGLANLYYSNDWIISNLWNNNFTFYSMQKTIEYQQIKVDCLSSTK